jgi:hypothetical protein
LDKAALYFSLGAHNQVHRKQHAHGDAYFSGGRQGRARPAIPGNQQVHIGVHSWTAASVGAKKYNPPRRECGDDLIDEISDLIGGHSRSGPLQYFHGFCL